MDSDFRQLDAREMGILKKLLDAEFPGHEDLRTQLNSLTGKQIQEDGTLNLMCDSGSPSPQNYGLAVEGVCNDADGGSISILLHVSKDGFMNMLEILRMDGSPILNRPSAQELVLRLPVTREREPGKIPRLPQFQIKGRAGGPVPGEKSEFPRK